MRRAHLTLIIAFIILCGSAVTWNAARAEREIALRGYADPLHSVDLPYRVPRLGVNADLTRYTDLVTELARMRALGVTWVRQRVSWAETEPTRGAFVWDAWDRIAAAFAAQPDLEWLPVFIESPAWARMSGSQTAPPDAPDDFARFAAAFAARYGESVDFYQIWDEPNLTAAWGDLEPRPADYVALLAATYPAIHAADPAATVIAAALAPTTEDTARNRGDLAYLRDLYALGARNWIDAAAAKPYGFDLPPDDRRVDPTILNFSRIIALREIMIANGDGGKALWASEWGWNALPPDWNGAPSIWGTTTPEQRAAYTLAALDRADREWAWLGGMIVESWQPNAPSDDPRWGFALIDSHGSPTLTWDALRARADQPQPMHGLYFPAHPNARYSGVWTFGELGADIGWVQDSQVTFDFIGTDIALHLRRDNYLAFLYPTLNGQPANAAPRDANGSAFITLRSADLTPRLDIIPVARDLPHGAHTLRLVADRGWDRWALAGFAVRAGDPAAPYDRQLAIAALTMLAACAVVVVSAAQIDWRPLLRRGSRAWARMSDAGQFGISAITSLALMVGMLLTWRTESPSIFAREVGILTPVQFGIAFATAGLIYIQPHVIVMIGAALILFWIVYQRPDLGLMLTLFYAPFFLFPVELYIFAFPMPEIILLITAAAALLRGLAAWGRTRQAIPRYLPTIRLTALDWAVLAWVILGGVSLIWAAYRAPAITEWRTLIIEPALFYAIYRTRPRDSRLDLRLIDTLIIACVCMTTISVLMYIRGDGIITAEGGAGRLAGVYGSPNNVGLFIGRCLPFALAFALMPLDRRRRVAAALTFIPLGGALILSQSAGALFIGVPTAATAVLIARYGRRALFPLIALGGLGAAGLAFALGTARFARILDFAQGTTFFRLRVWASAWETLREYPITGLGLDQFLYAFQGRTMLPDAWQEPSLSHPHNVVLDVWTRLGMAGLVIFIWLQSAFWRALRRAYRVQRADAIRRALIIGAIGSMINILAHGLVDNSLFVVDLALIFALLLGLAARSQNWGHDDKGEVA
jgi:O-antigen ligase